MCGLAGVASISPLPDGESLLHRMIDTMNHRGPDQDGVFLDDKGCVGLGHKRLSIIDLSAGRQPMTDADGILTLVFNGEIYNHHEIKADLLRKGHPIRSRSDTETLLYAYKEYGPACVGMLRGMFAFAVHDRRDGSVFLARDRLGIKPMYYALHGDALLFASECKAILEFPGFPRELDLEALSDYFSLMYVPAPKSIFKRIRKLPAGHWLKWGPGREIEIRRYWDLEFLDESEYGTEKDFDRGVEDLLEVLDGAVSSHMESDVPLGAFLSGGVDSAGVVAMMARHSQRRVLTNTIGFSHKSYDESRQAAESAEFLKTDHSEFQVEPDAVGIMDKLSWFYDEPFADSSMIPTYYVCEMARRKVTVALSGDGGDENFAGYRRYYFDHFENRIRNALPSILRTAVFRPLGSLYPKGDWMPQRLRAKSMMLNLSYPPVKGYFTSLTHFKPHMKAKLFSGDLQRSLGGYDSLSVFEDHWKNCNSKDPLSRVQYLDFKTYLVDDILTKVDRASMANSLEVRVPVLDHKVVELAARMPSSWKLKGRAGKFIFKRAMGKILPGPVLNRPKSGFSAPIGPWLRNELSGYANELLLGDGGLAGTGLFEKKYLEKLWKEHQSGMRNNAHPLFALLSFSLWHKRFITRG
jgi:asparagine synthase (glutamine-hydrolysing)